MKLFKWGPDLRVGQSPKPLGPVSTLPERAPDLTTNEGLAHAFALLRRDVHDVQRGVTELIRAMTILLRAHDAVTCEKLAEALEDLMDRHGVDQIVIDGCTPDADVPRE